MKVNITLDAENAAFEDDFAMTALQTLKGVIYSGPRRLTESEIVLLRQSKTEVARRARHKNRLHYFRELLRSSTTPTTKVGEERFSNPDEFFRVIVGDAAFQDIVDSGQVRTKTTFAGAEPGKITLEGRPTAFPSFSQGQAYMCYAKSNPNHYIIVAGQDAGIAPSTAGRHSKGKTMFPTSPEGVHQPSLDASKVQVYKHEGDGRYSLVWGKGQDQLSNKTR